MSNKPICRCSWTQDDPRMNHYHDNEWGVPLHDDVKHFEFLVLDAFQAGLSWKTILYRREGFRKAFDKYQVKKIARYTAQDVERLMQHEGIIRNRMKIQSTIKNAQAFIQIQKEFGSFDAYIWQFTGHKTIVNKHISNATIAATSKESDAMSKELKKRGFSFVGSTICYAYMQAAGMVNDHVVGCFRHAEVNR